MEVFQNTDLQIEFIAYLDKTGRLKQLEKDSIKYKQQVFSSFDKYPPPFRYSLSLDFTLAAEIAGNFVEVLLREAHLALEIARRVVWTCLRVLTDWYDLPEDWVYCSMKLDPVPNIPQLVVERPFDNNFPLGLFLIKAVVLALSPPYKYLVSSVYRCSMEKCFGRGVARRGSHKRICSHCGNVETPVHSTGVTGQGITAYIMPFSPTSSLNFSQTQHTIKISLRDEVRMDIELGMSCIFTCVVEPPPYGGLEILACWGFSPLISEPISRTFRSLPLPVLPTSVTQYLLYVREECTNSPWAVVTALACHLASNVYPLHSFLHLKTALLLSLASTGSSSPVSIVGIGDCCDQMMRSCSALLGRNFSSLSGRTWCPTVHQLNLHFESSSSGWAVSAGPLLMAQRGICYIGNCPKNTTQFMSYINTAVESEMVRIFWKKGCEERLKHGSGKGTGDSDASCKNVLPLNTAIWTHWNLDTNSKQDANQMRTLIELFGVPFIGDMDGGDESVVRRLLEQAAGYINKPPPLSNEDIKRYLEIISAQPVEMSEMARTLIQNYFVASRRHRIDRLPVKAVKILTSLCESHARLCLRTVASYDDAVAAIFLYEESLLLLFGNSVGNPPPTRWEVVDCLHTDNPSSDIIAIAKQVDDILSRFSVWLENYVINSANSVSIGPSDYQ